MMKWSRKTSELQFKPYYSADHRFRVQMLNDLPTFKADNDWVIKKYFELKVHNWDSPACHQETLRFKSLYGIKDTLWCLIDNRNNQLIATFRTAKDAKLYAERLSSASDFVLEVLSNAITKK